MPDMTATETTLGAATTARGQAGSAGASGASATSPRNSRSESPAAAVNDHGHDTKHGNTPWGVVIVLGILVIVGVGYGRWSAHRGRR